jgi:hypothetical protein
MARRATVLCSVFTALLLVLYIGRVVTPGPAVPATWLFPPRDSDAETLLAFGAQIPLACADVSQLELLPGVSESVAAEILGAYEEIRTVAAESGPEAAFTRVYGIGPAKAAGLARDVAVSGECFAHGVHGRIEGAQNLVSQ